MTPTILYIYTSYICLIYLCINDIDLIWYNLSSFGFRMWVWGDGGNVVSPIWSERGGSSTIPFFGCKNDGLLPQQYWNFYILYIYIYIYIYHILKHINRIFLANIFEFLWVVCDFFHIISFQGRFPWNLWGLQCLDGHIVAGLAWACCGMRGWRQNMEDLLPLHAWRTWLGWCYSYMYKVSCVFT